MLKSISTKIIVYNEYTDDYTHYLIRAFINIKNLLNFIWIREISVIQSVTSARTILATFIFTKKARKEKEIKNIPLPTSHDELDHSFRRIPVVHETLVHTGVGGGDGMQLQRIIFQRQGHSVLFRSPYDGCTLALILEQPHPVCPPFEHQHQRILRYTRTAQRDVLPSLDDHLLHQRIHGICEHRDSLCSSHGERYRCDKNIRDRVELPTESRKANGAATYSRVYRSGIYPRQDNFNVERIKSGNRTGRSTTLQRIILLAFS